MAEGIVWEGDALSVIVCIFEGDIGIMLNYELLLVILLLCVVEIFIVDGNCEVIVVDGGFISVVDNCVLVLLLMVCVAAEIDLKVVEYELVVVEK